MRANTVGVLLALIVAAPAAAQQHPAEIQANEVLAPFAGEPDVNRVQRAALDYAALHPEIYDAMRSRSRISAALPDLRFRVTKKLGDDRKEDVVTGGVSIVEAGDLDLQGEVRWRLGDIVFNARETAVVREGRYAVKERQRLLQSINQTYFERRRAQIDLMRAPATDPAARALAELKIAQLTAELDALTGGAFSRMINASR